MLTLYKVEKELRGFESRISKYSLLWPKPQKGSSYGEYHESYAAAMHIIFGLAGVFDLEKQKLADCSNLEEGVRKMVESLLIEANNQLKPREKFSVDDFENTSERDQIIWEVQESYRVKRKVVPEIQKELLKLADNLGIEIDRGIINLNDKGPWK